MNPADFNVLDWVLVVVVAAYALSGYWQGFITGAFATAGLLVGGVLGIWLAPLALGEAAPSMLVSLGAIFIVILSASLGQGLLQFLGTRIRDTVTWQPARALDAFGGAALSGLAVLVVAWALGVAVAGVRIPTVTPMVRGSTVLGQVDRVLPDVAGRALNSFNDVVAASFFPRYLEPFSQEQIIEVRPGDRRMITDPDVVRAEPAVLKVRGANECGRGVEGTGFVYAEGRLMTNAHVVAGVDEPEIFVGDGTVAGTVVHYDPRLDVAVLAFDAPEAQVLPWDRDPVAERDSVAILGYPEDGPYDIQAGRIRSSQRLRSPDIYGSGSVVREVYSVRALVRPGNSGGPLLDSEGEVTGVVFAASVTDAETGYALTARQVAEAAQAGRRSSDPVDTGGCAT